jgi:hypothetical protein
MGLRRSISAATSSTRPGSSPSALSLSATAKRVSHSRQILVPFGIAGGRATVAAPANTIELIPLHPDGFNDS